MAEELSLAEKVAAHLKGLDAETAKLDHVFRPRSVAVIGASTRLDSIGGRLVYNLLDYGFKGELVAVNPTAKAIGAVPCYPSIEDAPGEIDLALVSVRRDAVLETVEACGRKGVRAIVVITAGFREVGGEGIELERRLVEIVQRYGMRMIGPNCYGVLNTDPEISLDATFGRVHPRRGHIAFLTQSGALGQIIVEYALRYGVGFSMMGSVGNKANVSGNDLLLFWEDDPDTDLILLYLESLGNPQRFREITRRITKRKPILAVKAGRSEAGARATVSHTGALAGRDAAVDALFEQCGILRADTLEDLFDLTLAMAYQPVPRGDRVAVMTNAGGPGVMATDAVAAHGLRMAELAEATQAHLKSLLPPAASAMNPVDLLATGSPEQYGEVMESLLADPGVDALLVIFVPPLMVDTDEVLRRLAAVGQKARKTILGCIMGTAEEKYSTQEVFATPRIPAYRYPESAVKSLASMVRYARWKERPEGRVCQFAVDRGRAETIMRRVRERGERRIVGAEALEVLAAYGIPVAPVRTAQGAEEVLRRSSEMGFPLAMKVASAEILHKTEVGGVVLDLRNEQEVLGAYRDLDRRIRDKLGADRPSPVILQRMLRGGVETVMGMTMDPSFGPLLMFGLGGIHVELLKDVSFRLLPISDGDARDMIRNLKGYPLLSGFRGAPPVDRALLEECLLRLAQLAGDFTEIEELDVNPFVALGEGHSSGAVDARFVLRP